jgi:outer membrane cobalamin receptor
VGQARWAVSVEGRVDADHRRRNKQDLASNVSRFKVGNLMVKDRRAWSILGPLALLFFFANVVAQQQDHSGLVFEGVVIDSNGAPIPDAQVSLASGDRVLVKTNTDGKGGFQLQTEARKELKLVVESSGFARHELQLLSLSQSALRVTLLPAVVSARVIVSATRVASPQSETAASVSVLDTKDLQATSAITLDDTLRQVPGFSLFRRSGSRTANPTTQGVSLRGVGASGASRALVMVDGIGLNDPFGGWVYWNRIPRESIDKVEVLLGGASHVYGSTALAGLIDIATKSVSENHLSLSASYGNEATPNVSIFMSGRKNDWSASVAGEIFRTNGYVLISKDQRGLVDTPAGSRSAVVNLRLQRTFDQKHRFFTSASFFAEARKNGTPLQINRTHLRQFSVGLDLDTTSAGFFAARVTGSTQVFDQNFSAVSADRNSENLTRVQRVPAQTVGASFQWTRANGTRQTLVAGAETREVRGASDEIVFVNGQAGSLVGSGGREHTSGVYVEDLLQIGSRLFLNLGARLDHWRNIDALSSSRSLTSSSSTTVTLFPDRSENALSGQVSGVYKINDRVSTVVSLLRAFRAPTLNELYRSFRVGNVLTLANENLRAERLSGGEAGVRVSALDDRLNVRGNFFWNEITRPVANVTLQSTPSLITRQRQNLGRTRSRGFELYSEAALNRDWSLTAGYLFADASVVRFPANALLEGLRIPQIARHQFTFQSRYSNPSITIGLQGRAASSQFDDDQNIFQLAPYFTLDAFVARRLSDRFEIFCAIENILNQRYEAGKTPVTTLGPPILVRGGFRVQLGQR